MKDKELILKIEKETGASLMSIKGAIHYARMKGNEELIIPYLHAYTSPTPHPTQSFDDKVLYFWNLLRAEGK